MNYKTCTKCGKEYEATTEFFHKSKTCKFGIKAECKICLNKRSREWYKNNKEKRTVVMKKYNETNKEILTIYKKKWYNDNKEKILIRTKKYYKNNKKRVTISLREYKKNNAGKVNALNAKRRARKLNQTPDLIQDEKYQVEMIYKRSQELGPDWQVDHIIPLSKGGLHHPDNLQIVTKEYNLEKRAKLNFRLPTETEIFNWRV